MVSVASPPPDPISHITQSYQRMFLSQPRTQCHPSPSNTCGLARAATLKLSQSDRHYIQVFTRDETDLMPSPQIHQ